MLPARMFSCRHPQEFLWMKVHPHLRWRVVQRGASTPIALQTCIEFSLTAISADVHSRTYLLLSDCWPCFWMQLFTGCHHAVQKALSSCFFTLFLSLHSINIYFLCNLSLNGRYYFIIQTISDTVMHDFLYISDTVMHDLVQSIELMIYMVLYIHCFNSK